MRGASSFPGHGCVELLAFLDDFVGRLGLLDQRGEDLRIVGQVIGAEGQLGLELR